MSRKKTVATPLRLQPRRVTRFPLRVSFPLWPASLLHPSLHMALA